MDQMIVNNNELSILYGLPHIQQLVYLRAVRPYMDVKTGIVGIKRKISHQSISEQLYIEPHPGIKSESFSRGQVRRALASLERAGLISMQSEGLQLILKCNLATLGYSVQNKADINPAYQANIISTQENSVKMQVMSESPTKGDIAEPQKAATPLKEINYIYLLSQFEKFWSLYPEKKSKPKAQAAFEQLNPNAGLFEQMLQALQTQINHAGAMQLHGIWVPPWKYPANWLAQRCWEDETPMDALQEKKHAEHPTSTRKSDTTTDPFCPPSERDEEHTQDNVIPFQRYL